jgi:hypothetical protein
MLVSLPSKIGDVSGLDAHLPQSQYYANILMGGSRKVSLLTYRLSSGISTFVPQCLFIRPGEVPVPREEISLQERSVKNL